MSPPACQLRLPDLLSACPLKDETNPHYKEVVEESRAWISSFDILSDRKRSSFFEAQFETLCSHAYPYANHEQLRIVCDFVHFVFIIDHVTDVQNGKDAKKTCQDFVDGLKYSKGDDSSKISKMAKDFRARFMRYAGVNNARRFFDLCETYAESVTKEAELREQGELLGLEEFIPHRRENSGVMPCFSIAECFLGVDLDDEVYEDPTFKAAYFAALDYIYLSNDVYSYAMEESRGLTGTNFLAILVKEKGISLQEASDYAGNYCNHLLDTYMKAREQLYKSQSLGPEATQLIYAIGHWMIANHVWSFETPRYFGSRGLEVKATGVVTIQGPSQKTHDDSCDGVEYQCTLYLRKALA